MWGKALWIRQKHPPRVICGITPQVLVVYNFLWMAEMALVKDETLREKDDLKAKLEQFETSSKNLNKLINSQLSSKDKTGLGYGDQLNENDSSGSELFNSVFDSRSSDGDDNQTNDRFKKDNGYHVVPPPLTGNYMPPLADLSFAGLDDSVYRPTANKTSVGEWLKSSVLKIWEEFWVKEKLGQFGTVSQRINHQNKFVPSAVLTRFGRVPVSAAKQSSLRATTSTSTFRPGLKSVVALGPHRKDTDLSYVLLPGEIPQQALKNKGIFDSGCSRHMTGNKDFLTDYQELDGGFVAFGGSDKDGQDTH
ncbi:hypothetical protein Tco_1130853 [Tanacetum coccineum]